MEIYVEKGKVEREIEEWVVKGEKKVRRLSVRRLNSGYDGWMKDGRCVYVGRKNEVLRLKGSVLMNKFKIGIDGRRDEVIEMYRKWLWEEVKMMNFEVVDELLRLKEIEDKGLLVLVCWCDEDEKCHSDVIISCLKWLKGG